MPTVRIHDDTWEELEIIALYQSNQEGKIITVPQVLKSLIDKHLPKELEKVKRSIEKDRKT